MKSIGTLILYVFLVSIIPISVGLYIYNMDNNSKEIMSTDSIIFTQTNNKNSVIIKVRNMLVNKKFEELNKYLKKIDENYKKDVRTEDLLFTVYYTFGIEDLSYLKFFNEWINGNHSSSNAYLARAIYFYHMGWHERGHRYVSETKNDQFDKMYEYFKKSYDDINKYVELNENTVISYLVLIGIHTTSGQDEIVKKLMKEALKINNNTLKIRQAYLKSITPRWGGSYPKMNRYLENMQFDLKAYPKLKVLYGVVYIEKAVTASIASKYNVAHDFLEESRTLSGEYESTLFKLGKNYVRRKMHNEAINSLTRAIELNSEDSDYYYWRSKAYTYEKEYEKAKDDILYAYELKPYSETIIERRIYLSDVLNSEAYKLRKKYLADEALEKYSLALELNLDNDSIYYGLAQAYILKHDLTSALSNIKIAIEIAPNNIDHYVLLDYILAKENDWNQIISYWDKFIELNPENGRAYVERGGAYYHKGDIKKAVENAKISADLGNLEGEEAYAKFKHLAR